MTLQDALTYFKNLASKKSEIKVYQHFIQVLTSLQNRDLSDPERAAIEQELDALDLNSASSHSHAYVTKALKQFQKFLKDAFSLTTKNHYTNIGLGLGMSFGVVFGILFFSNLERSLGVALGISLGMVIGLIIGRTLDSQAKAAGRMI